jgi:hypothetical protein
LVLAFPNEILTRILELASLGPDPSPFSRGNEIIYLPGAIKPLLRTCRRFYSLAVTFNYRAIKIAYPTSAVPSDQLVKALHRTLQENPALGQHCREFWFHLTDIVVRGNITVDDYKFLREIALSLPNVEHLDIHGGFSGARGTLTWDLLRDCVRTMPSLRQVSLAREGFDGLTVPQIMEVFQSPSLRSISAGGVAKAIVSSSFWESQVCARCVFSFCVFCLAIHPPDTDRTR